MREINVKFSSSEKVQSFARVLLTLPGEFELISDYRIVDARSIMGIFSLDIQNPIKLKIYEDSNEALLALAPFTV